MKVNVRGKNKYEVSDKINEYATSKIQKMNHYFRNPEEITASVLCKAYGEYKTVEVTIPTKNIILRAEVNGPTIYEAIDTAIERLEKQMVRHKTKIAKAIKHREGVSGFYANELQLEEKELEPNQSESSIDVLKEKQIDVEEMDREDAITRMEMLDHDFFLFIDSKTHKPSVVYIRKDGSYGVIDAK